MYFTAWCNCLGICNLRTDLINIFHVRSITLYFYKILVDGHGTVCVPGRLSLDHAVAPDNSENNRDITALWLADLVTIDHVTNPVFVTSRIASPNNQSESRTTQSSSEGHQRSTTSHAHLPFCPAFGLCSRCSRLRLACLLPEASYALLLLFLAVSFEKPIMAFVYAMPTKRYGWRGECFSRVLFSDCSASITGESFRRTFFAQNILSMCIWDPSLNLGGPQHVGGPVSMCETVVSVAPSRHHPVKLERCRFGCVCRRHSHLIRHRVFSSLFCLIDLSYLNEEVLLYRQWRKWEDKKRKKKKKNAIRQRDDVSSDCGRRAWNVLRAHGRSCVVCGSLLKDFFHRVQLPSRCIFFCLPLSKFKWNYYFTFCTYNDSYAVVSVMMVMNRITATLILHRTPRPENFSECAPADGPWEAPCMCLQWAF